MEHRPEVLPEFEIPPNRVYARVDGGLVNGFFSTVFSQPTEHDILYKEGFGDEFVHVSYLQVYDDKMCHNYKVGTITEDGEVINVIMETSDEEKLLEFNSRPVPPTQPTIGDLITFVESLQEDTSALFEGVFDINSNVDTIQTDTTVLFEGLIEVDTKTSDAQKTISTHEEDIAIVMDALCDIDNKVNKILEHLKLNI